MINSGFFSNMVNGGEMGHGYPDLRRNMNEEFILKSMVESSNKMPIPNMEIAGFRNHFQTLRTDSEELFKSWITSEESHSFNSSSLIQRTPQAAGRMARELNYITTQDDENSTKLDQGSFRNVVGRGVVSSDPHLDKAWFHSTQPMTRSRSSDLRKNFATLQNFQTSVTMETMNDASGFNFKNPKQETENSNEFFESPFNYIPNHKQDSEDGSLRVYGVQEVLGDMGLDQSGQITYHSLLATHDIKYGQNMDTACESSIRLENGRNNESGNSAGATDFMTISNNQKPKERLVRSGSVSSADPVDEGETTKKRRVERSRKMAEAKERILTPTVPLDMQSIVKRCECLEKEVRSLKLNLAFMNRKDSEQTKQLEELQIHHEELTEEKERLLEEIERIISLRRKM